MPRKYTVESKYKNPDKYIEVLKNTVQWKDECMRLRDKWREEDAKKLGNHWFTYEDGVTIDVTNFDREEIKQVSCGDKVRINGEVTSINKDSDGSFGLVLSLGEVMLIDD